MTIIDTTIGPRFETSVPTVRVKDQSVFDDQINEFLRGGGSIEKVPFGMVSNMDNSQAAINARTWHMEHPDAVVVTGTSHITNAMLQYANKRLAKRGGGPAPNLSQVAKEMGVSEPALHTALHKHRQLVAAKSGAKSANASKRKQK